jgi:hypothetical protein
MNTDSGETADSLISTAGAHEHRVTPVMLKKWRDAGLLPRPRQQSLGRGRGTVAIYPDGTSAHLLRLLTIRAEGGRFSPEQTLWRLWWEGFSIDPARVRALLETQLREFEAWRDEWSGLTPDERIERLARLERLPEPLRSFRKRMGSRAFESLSDVLTRVVTGEFTTWETTIERNTMLSGLGLNRAKRDRIGRSEPWLRGMLDEHLNDLARTIQPDRLRDTFTNASDDEICDARDEMQAFFGLLYTVRLTLESISGDSAFGLSLVPHPHDVNHQIMPTLLLGWLAFRRVPTLFTGFETLMQFAESGAPLSFFIDLMRDTNTEKLPRRLAPSGSAADGKESSTCTTSLPPSPRLAKVSSRQRPSRETASLS